MKQHRKTSDKLAHGGADTILSRPRDDGRSWITYREGLARAACSPCELPCCPECSAPLDRHPEPHSPRCEEGM